MVHLFLYTENMKKWITEKKYNKTFYVLRKLIETSENEHNVDLDTLKEQTKKAFEALSFIFCDLCR